ncbi:MAG: hypothetical protein RL141_488 [Candidatus Parcubacteria bacterium]
MRAMVEDEVRQEEGLEPVDRDPLLTKLEQFLPLSESQAEKRDDRVEEELWRHAWYSYTDEWAWYRARMDVLGELGSAAGLNELEIEERTHQRYHEKFEEYIREIDMIHGGNDGKKRVPTAKGSS